MRPKSFRKEQRLQSAPKLTRRVTQLKHQQYRKKDYIPIMLSSVNTILSCCGLSVGIKTRLFLCGLDIFIYCIQYINYTDLYKTLYYISCIIKLTKRI